MAEYFGTFDGIQRDELAGGADAIPESVWNVNVGASAVIKRGMLLAGDTATGEFAPVSSAADRSEE